MRLNCWDVRSVLRPNFGQALRGKTFGLSDSLHCFRLARFQSDFDLGDVGPACEDRLRDWIQHIFKVGQISDP